jgi:CRISPR-associated protein Cmr6
MITFYDAVPRTGQEGLLQLDLVNPHYPAYYRKPATTPPSDDQDPIPVTFLAVKPGAVFDFAFSVAPMPRSDPRDEEERERFDTLGKLDAEAIRLKVEGWLKKGLETWGIGGKTAAGYGYMAFRNAKDEARARLESITKESADVEVPRYLAELSGEAAKAAAREIVSNLGGRWLRRKQDQAWVQALFALAQE